jgi:nematocidal protein AidA
MSDVINVLISVDTETLVQQGISQDPNNPTQVSGGQVFAIVRAANALSGEGGSELNISAYTEDIVRWRLSSLSLNDEQMTLPYRLNVSSGADLLKDLGASISTVTVPLPKPHDPLNPTSQTIQDYYWEAEVQQPGSATYQFQFMIINRHSQKLGYCTWDPFITIKS